MEKPADEALEDALKAHDFYSMLANGRVYQAGVITEQRVRVAYTRCVDELGQEIADQIWNRYAPDNRKVSS